MAEQPFPGVLGFLTPAMVERLPNGQMLNAFTNPEDVHRIEQSYACGNCCAIFDGFRLDCPICKKPTHVTKQRQVVPQEWADYVKGREGDGAPTPMRTFDDAMRDVLGDGDVDHVNLSKLKPSKWGRGG